MSKQEIVSTRYGEMMDMISCLSVYEGSAKLKKKKKRLTYDEAIALR